jgi:hypothetical protein
MNSAETIARLEEEIRFLRIGRHLKHIDEIVNAVEDKKLTLDDLTRVVSIERLRAIFCKP